MKAKLLGISLFLMIISSSCSDSRQERRDSKLVDELIYETAKKLRDQDHLFLIGTGASMMYDIRMLAMSFCYYNEVDQKKARELVLKAAEEYLSVINGNEEIQPYLHNRPFTFENLEIMIQFFEPDGSFVPPKEISLVGARKGQIMYNINEPETRRLKTIFSESYEEALRAR